MHTTLEAQNLTKRYGDFQALSGASLSLVQGEILALLGPNGAGKTTLVKILATLLNKDAGKVTILGLDLDHDAEAIRHRQTSHLVGRGDTGKPAASQRNLPAALAGLAHLAPCILPGFAESRYSRNDAASERSRAVAARLVANSSTAWMAARGAGVSPPPFRMHP